MKVVFMGSPDFAVPALQAVLERHEVCLVVTQPDKRAGRGKKITACAVADFARSRDLPLLQPQSAKKAEFAKTLAATGAEVGIVVAYGKILPPAVLAAFPHGCLNIHASILPELRGAAPIQWSILREHRETGVSIMMLDEGMDTGPVFAVERIPIKATETSGELFERLAPLGAKLLLEVLESLSDGKTKPIPQEHAEATYAPMLKKSDGQIDWCKSATEVSAKIRGVDPWPGAFTDFLGGRLKVFGATVIEKAGKAGELLSLEGESVDVGCGQDAVRIQEVQAAGKKRMKAAEFFKTRQIVLGTILDQENT